MEVKLREFHGITDNIIEKILRLRGVEKKNVKHYLFPSEELKPDYNRLDNIEEAIDLLHQHLQDESKIMIIQDADMDGICSASIIFQYLTRDLNYPLELVEYYMHEGKTHGIPKDKVLESNPDLLIVPDAGSSEFDIHKILANNNIQTLVLDHHQVDGNRYSTEALVVNNQLSDEFPWKGLTGANIVYLFCEAYSDKYNGSKDISHYDDLNFSGMLADRASLLDLGVYYYYNKGAGNIQNPFFKQIIEKSNNISVGDRLTPKNIGWDIAPYFNSMIRSGTQEDLQLVIDAVNGLDYEVYNTRLKDSFPVAVEAMRKTTNTRQRQSKIVKQAREEIQERIAEMGTDEHKVILVNATDIIEDPSITGLVATQIANNYKKPTLILKYYPEREELSGSGRNFNDSPLIDFKSVIEETGLFSLVAGHNEAMGVSLPIENAGQVTEVFNELLADVEYDNLLHVADLRYSQEPDAREILEIAKHSHLWGEGLFEPVVHVEDIQIPKKDIKFIGQKGDTWKLNLKTCDAIMFKLTESQKLALTNHNEDLIRLSIVGECSINTYRGQQKPQIIIKDFEAEGLADYEQNPWQNFDVTALPF